MRTRMRCCSAGLAIVLTLQGCSSAPKGQPVEQAITVETPACRQVATCELRNDVGLWSIPSTPGTVTVTTSFKPLEIMCSAGANAHGSALVSGQAAGTTGIGATAGGVMGFLMAGMLLGPAAFMLGSGPVLAVLGGGTVAGASAANSAEAGATPIRYPATVSVPLVCAASS